MLTWDTIIIHCMYIVKINCSISTTGQKQIPLKSPCWGLKLVLSKEKAPFYHKVKVSRACLSELLSCSTRPESLVTLNTITSMYTITYWHRHKYLINKKYFLWNNKLELEIVLTMPTSAVSEICINYAHMLVTLSCNGGNNTVNNIT